MHRLGIVGLFVALTALVACSNDDSSTGGPAPVGPAPASKQAAAEDLNEATAALSGALSESKGSTKTKAAGLAPQTTVSVSGSCAGGGTLDATASADANVNGGSSGQSSSAVVDYTITAHGCKTAKGYLLEGGPLTMHVDASSTVTATDAGVSSSSHSFVKYNGSMTITGPLNASFSYSDLSIDSSVDVSSGSSKVKVVINGAVTVNGGTYSFANEAVEISASR
ncbi:MAG: hypothetical protein U0270_44700 [Labilithrix sp.]